MDRMFAHLVGLVLCMNVCEINDKRGNVHINFFCPSKGLCTALDRRCLSLVKTYDNNHVGRSGTSKSTKALLNFYNKIKLMLGQL